MQMNFFFQNEILNPKKNRHVSLFATLVHGREQLPLKDIDGILSDNWPNITSYFLSHICVALFLDDPQSWYGKKNFLGFFFNLQIYYRLIWVGQKIGPYISFHFFRIFSRHFIQANNFVPCLLIKIPFALFPYRVSIVNPIKLTWSYKYISRQW